MQDSRVLAFVLEKLKMQEICFEAVRQAGHPAMGAGGRAGGFLATVRQESADAPESENESAGPMP